MKIDTKTKFETARVVFKTEKFFRVSAQSAFRLCINYTNNDASNNNNDINNNNNKYNTNNNIITTITNNNNNNNVNIE